MMEPALPRHFRGPAWVPKAVALHEQGYTNAEIGERLKISRAAVNHQLRRNADRLKPPEWISPLALEQEFGSAVSQQSFHRWAQEGKVRSIRTASRWRLYRPSVIEYITQMLNRPCTSCGQPVDSVQARDRVCINCRPADEAQEWKANVRARWRARWVELGKRLRNGA